MAILVSNIRVSSENYEAEAVSKAMALCSLSKDEIQYSGIYKLSKDARHKQMSLVASVMLSLKSSKAEEKISSALDFVRLIKEENEEIAIGKKTIPNRPVVVGFGPAGMFCALYLASLGYRPIVVERGDCVENRVKITESFWNGGSFSTETNVQFGEGGAGTFSDGKLTTRINDPLCRKVLSIFVENGAPESILKIAKPHIGSDNLRSIVKNIREKIIAAGGEVSFCEKLLDIERSSSSLILKTSKRLIESSCVVLALGHSARDTFSMLRNKGIAMESKPFSVGVRIEHTQKELNKSMYGEAYNEKLFGQAEYQLSLRENDKAVYSFCMCPGGVVVPSASEDETIVTNGMSFYKRDLENANSAIVVSVDKKDFGDDVFGGIHFQRELEKRAFVMAGRSYKAPAQTVGGYLDGKISPFKNISPSYYRSVEPCDLNELFPASVNDMLHKGLRYFGSKISCFKNKDAVLTGVETRTSCPIRITRDPESRKSIAEPRLYPCGEGAGYAGGIMSAAVDGINTALAIIKEYAPK